VRSNAAFFVLAALGLGAVLGLPLVTVAPNRLLSGQGVSLWQVMQSVWSMQPPTVDTSAQTISPWAPWLATAFLPALLAVLLVVLFALLAALSLQSPRQAGAAVLVVAGLLLPGLLLAAGLYAEQVSQTQSNLARTSLGSAFWVLVLLLWLAAMDALHRMQASLLLRTAVWLGIGLGVLGLLASGLGDHLSLMKEYANHADTLGGSVLRHLQIVALTLLATLCIGLPMGWVVNRSTRWQQWLLAPLSVVQTVPSIALFGLLMVPLAWLAGALPGLATWGVSGIGLAPAVVALTLYSLLPVVRGTQAGLAQVPTAVLDAARGMGMSAGQIFWSAQLPLAAPVILAGVRTATIQTVGLAAVAALIGAGGLGAIMFDGLFGSAQDLVLLGVLPIVGLALVLNLGFEVLGRWARPAALAALATPGTPATPKKGAAP
jgi:osmoprotectant transport system permease protein